MVELPVTNLREWTKPVGPLMERTRHVNRFAELAVDNQLSGPSAQSLLNELKDQLEPDWGIREIIAQLESRLD